MPAKKKRTCVKAVFLYLLMTTGSWIFLNSYAVSYNKLTSEKIAPAAVYMNADEADISVIGHSVSVCTSLLSKSSRLYYVLYSLSPDELRAITLFSDRYGLLAQKRLN